MDCLDFAGLVIVAHKRLERLRARLLKEGARSVFCG